MRYLILLATVCAAAASNADAQQTSQSAQCAAATSRLFPLEYIKNADAAQLVAPFVPLFGGCGVFEAGPAVRGITVKAPKDVIERVDSLLRANDKAPPTVVLRFQLIAALDSAGPADPSIQADVTAALQDLFRFRSYRLIAQGAITVGMGNYDATMAAAEERYYVNGTVSDIRVRAGAGTTGNAATVAMTVRLIGRVAFRNSMGSVSETKIEELLSTGLTTPIGQTVVLGSAAADAGRRALILTVRPELGGGRR